MYKSVDAGGDLIEVVEEHPQTGNNYFYTGRPREHAGYPFSFIISAG
jgi:hypothetical protein